MSNKHTPIEQWIDENTFICNVVCKKLLTYLGLQDQPDPKKWVEQMKQVDSFDILQMAKANSDLQAENERLREALKHIKAGTIEQFCHDLANEALKGE